MIRHYLKVSLREFVKYKTQSLVSIIGLAIGFTAFILGGYWLWWETHFDNFHPNGDRLYCLTTTGLVKSNRSRCRPGPVTYERSGRTNKTIA